VVHVGILRAPCRSTLSYANEHRPATLFEDLFYTALARSPFATTIWDYINRGMPLGKEGTLAPNEVYALTAFLLYKNDVIKEYEVMDAQSLPMVKMPNRNGFALPTEWRRRRQGFRVTTKP
jgi:hypothetical protein